MSESLKRIILEWTLFFSVGTALLLSTFWVHSSFVDQTAHHLRIPLMVMIHDDLHLLVEGGNFLACNQFDVAESGEVRPLILELNDLVEGELLRGDQVGKVTFPGVDFHSYRLSPSGYLIWSLRFSPLLPFLLLTLLSILASRSLKRLRLRRPSSLAPPPSSILGL